MMDKKEDIEMMAKRKAAEELRDLARKLMGDRVMSDMDEMQKVTVAAPDQESLEKGLSLAEDVVSDMPELPEMDKEGTLDDIDDLLEDEEDDEDEDEDELV